MTEIVYAKIKTRGGPKSDFIDGSGIILDERELGFSLDTRELFIGYGSNYMPAGNLKIITELDGLDSLYRARADYDMGSNRIINLEDPSNPKDAVNLRTLNDSVAGSNFTIKTRELVLSANTGSPAPVEIDDDPLEPGPDSLNAKSGQFSGFIVYYTVIREAAQRTGMLIINDTGSDTDYTDDSNEIGDVGITFSVAHVNGVRQLLYTTTDGTNLRMKFNTRRWV